MVNFYVMTETTQMKQKVQYVQYAQYVPKSNYSLTKLSRSGDSIKIPHDELDVGQIKGQSPLNYHPFQDL